MAVKMKEIFLLIIILLPFFGGACICVIKPKRQAYLEIFVETIVLLTSFLVFYSITHRPESSLVVFEFAANLTIAFHMDGLSATFAGLIAVLWPLATLYAFEYMRNAERKRSFFLFYTVTYAVTLGIAFAANLVTLYFFYEMLTLVTLPLVFYTMTREAVLASRKYLYYSLGGAAFAFIGLIFILSYGHGTTEFVLGGVLQPENLGGVRNTLLFVYVLSFFGFGVKAALFPFSSWLPRAGVAPTPVTALLHAVAVVKSGAFAILRITYYNFGADFLRGTWAQDIVMTAVIITILYGCSMALKERHLKRRLAYSTISNLSYLLFGAALMTPLGLAGALSHMVFHGIMKICAFFCAGAVIKQTEKEFIYELDGLGRKMPKVFGILGIASFSLMGVPGLCGFISKWNLAKAAVLSYNPIAYIGIGALLLSGLLTGIYMMAIVIRGLFPLAEVNYGKQQVQDPNWYMILPLIVLTVFIVYFGLFSKPIVLLFENIAKGRW